MATIEEHQSLSIILFFIFIYLNRVEIHSVLNCFTMCPVNEEDWRKEGNYEGTKSGGKKDTMV